ncbi:MAG: hypothetical protein CL846_06665 [Crocinitomicaceae bacterium]|nr:hypothetical protein [Crocinitomicaceae bacterium]
MKTQFKFNITSLALAALIFISHPFFGNNNPNSDLEIKVGKYSERYHIINNVAVKLSRVSDISKAIKNFQKSLLLEPENVFIQYNLANAFMMDSQNNNAIDIYKSLIGNEKVDQSLVLLNLANAFQQDNQIEKALELYGNIQLFEAAFNASVVLRKNGEYQKALFQAKRAVELSKNKKDKVLVLSNYANLLFLNDDIKPAINIVKKTIDIDKSSMKLKYDLAKLYVLNADYSNAKKTFKKIVQKKASNPFYYEALIGLSKINLIYDNFSDCMNNIEIVIENSPRNASAYLVKAQAFLNQKDYENAEVYFNKAFKLGLTKEAKIGLAVLNHKKGNFLESKLIYDSLTIKEQNFLSYDDLVVFSLNEYNLGNVNKAKEYVITAKNKNSKRPEAYGYLGKFSYDEFDYHAAQDYYNNAIKFAEDKSPYRVCLANCYAQTGNYRTAILVFNNLIKSDPNYAKAHSAKAMCLLKIDKYDKASIEIDEAIKLDPTEPFNYMNKSYLLSALALHEVSENIKSELLEDALENIKLAMNIDSTEISTHYNNNLALVHMEMGNLEKSLELLSIDTNRVTINNTGIYLEKIGNKDEAYIKYCQSLSIDANYDEALKNKNRLESNSSRKNKKWQTYWIFLTNDLFEIDGHSFSEEKYSLNQIESQLEKFNYYSFKYKKTKKPTTIKKDPIEQKVKIKYNLSQCISLNN